MTIVRLLLLVSLVAFTPTCQQSSPRQTLVPPASCPVTVPPATPFAPPSPYPSEAGEYNFWLGTEKLWTILPKSGVWWGWKPHEAGQENRVQPLTEKTGWGSVDFDLNKEPYPDLKVTGRRLDGDAPPLLTDTPTNALTGPTTDHAEMAIGYYVPTPGCWEITGEYRGQKLSYVVWVTAQQRATTDP
jgi:hypothetical protein